MEFKTATPGQPAVGVVPMSLDTSGKAIPSSVPATYRCQVADVTPAALATDVFVLQGSATKTVKIKRIQITADATSPSVLDLYCFKRTAANTGGAVTAPAVLKNVTANPAPTALVSLYSVNPATVGAGILAAADHYALPAAASTGYPGVPWVEDFGGADKQALELDGISEFLAVGLNGQTIPAGTTLYIMVEWTEQ